MKEFEGMDFSAMLKQVKEMQKKMEDISEDLAERVVEATAGGGVVKVLCNGVPQIVDIKISEEVFNTEDKQMLEDMIMAAVNEALNKIEQLRKEAYGKVMGQIGLPPFLMP
jgi:hypothetical protein